MTKEQLVANARAAYQRGKMGKSAEAHVEFAEGICAVLRECLNIAWREAEREIGYVEPRRKP